MSIFIYDDFDTLVPQSPQAAEQYLHTIQNYRNRNRNPNKTLVLVTKHSYATVNQLLPNWGELVDYLIADHGGAIFSCHHELIYIHELEHRIIRQVQSLVCDCALPISYSPYRCSIELMLGETAIKLRLWFKTKRRFQVYKDRLARQNWPIRIQPQIGTDFSQLPSGKSTNHFFGFIDILPSNGGNNQAIAYLHHL